MLGAIGFDSPGKLARPGFTEPQGWAVHPAPAATARCHNVAQHRDRCGSAIREIVSDARQLAENRAVGRAQEARRLAARELVLVVVFRRIRGERALAHLDPDEVHVQ